MFLSAASLFILGYAQVQAQNLDFTRDVWPKVSRSLVSIATPQATVFAALIDSNGLFLAPSSAITAPSVMGRSDKGIQVALIRVAIDEPSGLCLLQAPAWDSHAAPALRVATPAEVAGKPMAAAVPGLVVRGDYTQGNRIGVLRGSRRYLPLGEIRFESQQQRLGGALLFTSEGKLAGVLSATLDLIQVRHEKSNQAAQSDVAQRLSMSQFGPSGVTVSYTLTPEVLARVVQGFNRPDHRVDHPSIGLTFKDSKTRIGAEVASVEPGSPSQEAGLLPGDVVTELDGQPTLGAVDLAVALFRQKFGSTIVLTVMREDRTVKFKVRVGRLRDDAKISYLPLGSSAAIEFVN